MAAPELVSVILSTYCAPEWLEKVLWGYHAQVHRGFEIVVADDGSTPETAELLRRMAAETGLAIRHVWQRDDGFRKCRILNKAILHAAGDYLLFSDGDCIPRRDFVQVHARRARRGRYLSGSYCKLPMTTSRAITREDILAGRCFDPRWLRLRGLGRTAGASKVATPAWLAGIRNAITPTRCNFKGSNGSAWRDDVLAVNGMDERMPWGGEDREFGVRLRNLGLRPTHVRYDAIVVHLDHARGYRDEAQVRANRRLRQATQRDRTVRTPAGIEQLLAAGWSPAATAAADAVDSRPRPAPGPGADA